MQTVAIVVGGVAGIGVLALLFKPIFGSLDEFLRCIKFWFTPDMISMFRGEWGEDWWAEMKLGFWVAAGGICGVATFFGLMKAFG
jgi:hypothetical protein